MKGRQPKDTKTVLVAYPRLVRGPTGYNSKVQSTIISVQMDSFNFSKDPLNHGV